MVLIAYMPTMGVPCVLLLPMFKNLILACKIYFRYSMDHMNFFKIISLKIQILTKAPASAADAR
jgi:hypothetical protein